MAVIEVEPPAVEDEEGREIRISVSDGFRERKELNGVALLKAIRASV